MAENPVSTRPPLARKPHRYKVDEGLDVRFLCHANSTHVLQTLWRGLVPYAVGVFGLEVVPRIDIDGSGACVGYSDVHKDEFVALCGLRNVMRISIAALYVVYGHSPIRELAYFA